MPGGAGRRRLHRVPGHDRRGRHADRQGNARRGHVRGRREVGVARRAPGARRIAAHGCLRPRDQGDGGQPNHPCARAGLTPRLAYAFSHPDLRHGQPWRHAALHRPRRRVAAPRP
ncbi:hypothetical protein VARIO8X_60354 [Burkholderiales bacterium 8X]|nr:hypothetical protein VARIO8X_60354 [Burkholderiales bacterium 8X]